MALEEELSRSTPPGGVAALAATPAPNGDLEAATHAAGTGAASSFLSLRSIGATVARQIPVLKVTRSNRVSVTGLLIPIRS